MNETYSNPNCFGSSSRESSSPSTNVWTKQCLKSGTTRISRWRSCPTKSKDGTTNSFPAASHGAALTHKNAGHLRGVGKSHLAQAIENKAVLRGYDVLYRNTHALFKWLSTLLDDFGIRDLSDNQQADLYELIAERYKRRSTLITSNRDFDEWPMIFTNPPMGSAAMDRLVHRALKIPIDGKSYRLESFLKTSKALTKTTKTTM